MITLAIDTCDSRGSVAVRRDGHLLSSRRHSDLEFSSWLLPAVESSLTAAGTSFGGLDVIAAATGPGSFTGVRVGLCAVKAWAEVYSKPVIGVSRLEALARQATIDGWIAASYDAHRGQLFGGLYRRMERSWTPIEQEMVIAPPEFLGYVTAHSRNEAVQWICLDPELIVGLPDWQCQVANGSSLRTTEPFVANLIGELAEHKAARGEFTELVQLDANYVRRSDAEIYWKGPAQRVERTRDR